MYISLTDLFKIGIGPSSRIRWGRCGRLGGFLMELPDGMLADRARPRRAVWLAGAHRKGHGTDVAIQLGFCGELPDEVDTASIAGHIATIAREQSISLLGQKPVRFQPLLDIRCNLKDLLGRCIQTR